MSREGGSIAGPSSYEDPRSDDWSSADSGRESAGPTSARALADILREAGISSAGAGGRRRRRADPDSPSDQDVSPRASAAAPDNGFWGSDIASDLSPVEATDTFGAIGNADPFGAAERAGPDQPVPDDTQADFGSLSSYLLGSAHAAPGPAVPDIAPPSAAVWGEATPRRIVPGPAEPAPETGRRRVPPPRTDTGPVPIQGWASRGSGQAASSGSSTKTSAAAAADDLTAATGARDAPGATAAAASGAGSSAAPAHANRSPSPLAPAPQDDPDEADSAVALRSGAISWAILVVELLAAGGLGVAAWYAFSALWDLLPYAAALIGPLVVTGLVAVAGALRARTGRNPLGLPTLCILVFAGTVLVVLPAATLIVP